MAAGGVGLPRTAAELAQSKLAVGNEGAHAEVLGQRVSLPVVTFGPRHVARPLVQGNLAEEAQGPRLVPTLTALAGHAQGSPGELESVIEPVGEDVRFAQMHEERRLERAESDGLDGLQATLQQRDALGNTPRERIRVAQGPSVLREVKGQVPLTGHGDPAFE